jgi:histidinol-phosphate/aromatic aminotransferase/cobyric acid decarboxylase-like protein
MIQFRKKQENRSFSLKTSTEKANIKINSMPGFKAFPSEGNFVLIDASPLGKPSAEIMQAMIERGIFIRPMSGHNMPQGFIRITIGTPEQNQQFIETFRLYVAEVLDAPA